MHSSVQCFILFSNSISKYRFHFHFPPYASRRKLKLNSRLDKDTLPCFPKLSGNINGNDDLKHHARALDGVTRVTLSVSKSINVIIIFSKNRTPLEKYLQLHSTQCSLFNLLLQNPTFKSQSPSQKTQATGSFQSVLLFVDMKAEDPKWNNLLIPGLTDDVAIECLIRVPYSSHSEMGFVCQSWKALFSSDSFYKERRRLCFSEQLLCLVQPLIPTNQIHADIASCPDPKPSQEVGSVSVVVKTPSSQPSYGLSIYNATNQTWQRVYGKQKCHQFQVPMFCHCVTLPELKKMVLVGGWDPLTLEPTSSVYVFDFVTRRLGRGASMKKARSFFACASVEGSRVYVAGGHDGQKNALKSAEVYDVEKDEWTTLPEMEQERDECHGMWWSGEDSKFWVVSGYGTENQGRFRRDAECYDPKTNSWSSIDNVWPFTTLSPRCTAAITGTNGPEWHWFLGKEQLQGVVIDTDVAELDVVRSLIPVPEGMSGSNLPCVASSGVDDKVWDQIFVMGSSNRPSQVSCSTSGDLEVGQCCDREAAFSFGKDKKWRHVHTPSGFSGFPYSAAYLVI